MRLVAMIAGEPEREIGLGKGPAGREDPGDGDVFNEDMCGLGDDGGGPVRKAAANSSAIVPPSLWPTSRGRSTPDCSSTPGR